MKPYKTHTHCHDVTLTLTDEWAKEVGVRYIKMKIGQEMKVFDRVCRKTGLRLDDGSSDFGDHGFDLTVELLYGRWDGLVGSFLDDGVTGDDLPTA